MDRDFLDAINQHDLTRVRMMLSNELLLDSRGGTYYEMLSSAKKYLPDLFEIDIITETEEFASCHEEQWSMNIVSQLKMELNANFSEDKLSLYERMVQKLVPMSKMTIQQQLAPSSQHDNTNYRQNDYKSEEFPIRAGLGVVKKPYVSERTTSNQKLTKLISSLRKKIADIEKELNGIKKILNDYEY